MTSPISLYVAWHPKAEQKTRLSGFFTVRNGSLSVHACSENVVASDVNVEIQPGEIAIAELRLDGMTSDYGPKAPIVRWVGDSNGFAFLPLSVPLEGVIQVPDFGVVIGRSLEAVRSASLSASTYADAINRGSFPRGREIGWDEWANRNKTMVVPTFLGLSRDQRLFAIDTEDDMVRPSVDFRTATVYYHLCHSATADKKTVRRLEDGALPILHTSQSYGDLLVEDTFFATFADRPLTEENLAGTPLNIAHHYSALSTFPEEMIETLKDEVRDYRPTGEMVLYVRTRLTNLGDTPLVAPRRFPRAFLLNVAVGKAEEFVQLPEKSTLDQNGVAWTDGKPFSLHRFNGQIPESLQPCLLLAPQGSMTLDSILSHRVEGLSQATQNGPLDWDAKFAEAKAFWEKMLLPTAISLPEERLNKFWTAGRAHLELVTLGEKDGTLLPKVGIYAAIGSESIPIVEYYDSIGAHDIARRCLDSFFDLQHSNGRINLYSYYDVETGAALYLAGRHFAYAQDKEWVCRRSAGIKAATDYLLSQRQMADPSAPNYGLVVGNCADPVDAHTAFMLNAYNAAGLLAAADLLKAVGDEEAARYHAFAEEYADRLRRSIAESFMKGPLLPTAPDRWVPTCSSWIEGNGLQVMGLSGEASWTHATYMGFDAIIGPLYAVYTGIISPDDRFAEWLLEVNHRQMNRASVGESQPYYSRHPEVHLLRGEREAFLNAFYSGLCSLADRETFTFWEHYHKVTPHKTHEEAWALMQLRRMLWLEADAELRLLPGIPDQWLDRGNEINLGECGSYFGGFRFRMERSLNDGSLHLSWNPKLHSAPERLRVHLPGLNISHVNLNDRITVSGSGWIEIADPMKPLEAGLLCL